MKLFLFIIFVIFHINNLSSMETTNQEDNSVHLEKAFAFKDRAQSYLERGKAQKAQENFCESGLCFLNSGKYAEASSVLNTAALLVTAPKNLPILLECGENLLSEGIRILSQSHTEKEYQSTQIILGTASLLFLGTKNFKRALDCGKLNRNGSKALVTLYSEGSVALKYFRHSHKEAFKAHQEGREEDKRQWLEKSEGYYRESNTQLGRVIRFLQAQPQKSGMDTFILENALYKINKTKVYLDQLNNEDIRDLQRRIDSKELSHPYQFLRLLGKVSQEDSQRQDLPADIRLKLHLCNCSLMHEAAKAAQEKDPLGVWKQTTKTLRECSEALGRFPTNTESA